MMEVQYCNIRFRVISNGRTKKVDDLPNNACFFLCVKVIVHIHKGTICSQVTDDEIKKICSVT